MGEPEQLSLPTRQRKKRIVHSFDGDTFEPKKDAKRLSGQLYVVRDFMLDRGGWWTLGELEMRLGYPQASISARLRDLRKERFGGYTVERRRRTEGTFEYRIGGAE